MNELEPIPVTVRTYDPARDRDVCTRLYREGLIGGRIAENDTGLDIDDISLAYLSVPGNHFWVAQDAAGEIVGMIGVQQHEDSEGEIRRLRVRQDVRRRGIGSALLEKAIGFCRERGYLKIKLDTFMERDPALKLFDKFKFRHSRTREVGGKSMLYFYLDLYSNDPPRRKSDQPQP